MPANPKEGGVKYLQNIDSESDKMKHIRVHLFALLLFYY